MDDLELNGPDDGDDYGEHFESSSEECGDQESNVEPEVVIPYYEEPPFDFVNDYPPHKEEIVPNGPTFDPPVYKQRYEWTCNVLKAHPSIKSVLDMGCAEGSLLLRLRDVENLERIMGMDVDENCARVSMDRVRSISFFHHIIKRSRPLEMRVYEGSVVIPDSRVADVDAVTLIEVIEHLYDGTIEALRKTVFGTMQPDLVLMTTPNSEFNILFPNFEGMRHPDHKFEWTRCEFSQWCDAVCKEYSYSVTYNGIADGPEGTEELGCCSQAAIFKRTGPRKARPMPLMPAYFETGRVTYPYDNTTAEERLMNEVQRVTYSKARDQYLDEDMASSTVVIRTAEVVKDIRGMFPDGNIKKRVNRAHFDPDAAPSSIDWSQYCDLDLTSEPTLGEDNSRLSMGSSGLSMPSSGSDKGNGSDEGDGAGADAQEHRGVTVNETDECTHTHRVSVDVDDKDLDSWGRTAQEKPVVPLSDIIDCLSRIADVSLSADKKSLTYLIEHASDDEEENDDGSIPEDGFGEEGDVVHKLGGIVSREEEECWD